jgi:hypothetical protein
VVARAGVVGVVLVARSVVRAVLVARCVWCARHIPTATTAQHPNGRFVAITSRAVWLRGAW